MNCSSFAFQASAVALTIAGFPNWLCDTTETMYEFFPVGTTGDSAAQPRSEARSRSAKYFIPAPLGDLPPTIITALALTIPWLGPRIYRASSSVRAIPILDGPPGADRVTFRAAMPPRQPLTIVKLSDNFGHQYVLTLTCACGHTRTAQPQTLAGIPVAP
jgi:hypothetical protein